MNTGLAGAQKQTPARFEFDEMHLQVGGRLQVITHRGIKPILHFSTLIGYVKDEYLIIKIPFENGTPIILGEGEKLTMRAFSGVTVCSFSGTVERVFQRPLLYVHVSFPRDIQGTSLRTAMRVKVDIPVTVTGVGAGADAAPVSCSLLNLSVTGALIESAVELPADDELVALQFTLSSPPNNHQVHVNTRATIKNVNVVKPAAADKSEMFTYGIMFADLDPAHYTLVQNMTYEALITDRQKIV